MKSSLNNLQKILGYQFKDISFLELALTHRSKGANNNERLEFLGDAILGFVVAELLYAQYQTALEGHLSRFRASLVKKETLADIARGYSLGDYLQLGPGELKSGGFRRDSILADTMEAIFGAMYLDGGIEAVRALIERSLADRLATLSIAAEHKDPKTRLQEYLQGKKSPLPEYEVVGTHGDEHEQIFEVHCRVSGLDSPVEGKGTNRRGAEQAAAQKALELLIHDEG